MVAGFGWRAGATPASLRAALELALRQVSGLVGPLTLLATAEDKAQAACLQTLAAQLGLPVRAVPLALLRAMPTATRNAVVERLRGSGSVAEAAALAAAQAASQATASATVPSARLLHSRSISPDRLATCALATFDPRPEPLP